MKNILIGLFLFGLAATSTASDEVYEGTWLTTNRRLDGTLTSVVTPLGDNKWRGHFYGEWEGIPFSYKVEFSGPPENLSGTAVVDGARYRWSGIMSKKGWFKGTFDGDRYIGSFELKRKK
jgi:hypothetical protein